MQLVAVVAVALQLIHVTVGGLTCFEGATADVAVEKDCGDSITHCSGPSFTKFDEYFSGTPFGCGDCGGKPASDCEECDIYNCNAPVSWYCENFTWDTKDSMWIPASGPRLSKCVGNRAVVKECNRPGEQADRSNGIINNGCGPCDANAPQDTCVSGPVQIGEDIFEQAETGGKSGHSVSLSADGTVLAVGAPDVGDGGQVRVYRNDGGDWKEIGQAIDGEQPTGDFGWSLALNADGTVLAVGDPIAAADQGEVFVYRRDGEYFVRSVPKIDDTVSENSFGFSLCLSADGTVLAVGAPMHDDSGLNAGYVRVYKINGESWDKMGEAIDGEAENDEFGSSVSLSGDGTVLAVGAYKNKGQGSEAGHVRVYSFYGDMWIQMGDDIDGKSAGDKLGYEVSLNDDGTVLAISAPGAAGVYVYKYDRDNWIQMGQPIANKVVKDENGWIVSLSGDGTILAAASRLEDDNNGTPQAEALVFRLDGDDWVPARVDFDVDRSGQLSVSLSGDGTTLAIGAEAFSDYGRARVFDISTAGEVCREFPDDLKNVRSTPHLPVYHGDSVMLQCEDGYMNMGGSETATCENGKIVSDSALYCVEEQKIRCYECRTVYVDGTLTPMDGDDNKPVPQCSDPRVMECSYDHACYDINIQGTLRDGKNIKAHVKECLGPEQTCDYLKAQGYMDATVTECDIKRTETLYDPRDDFEDWMCAEWSKLGVDETFEHDKSAPFVYVIRTTENVNSGDFVKMHLLAESSDSAGAIGLKFSNPPEYFIECRGWTSLEDITISKDQECMITVGRRTAAPRIVILCNDEEIVNIELSDSTCKDTDYVDDWKTVWWRDVTNIRVEGSSNDAVHYCSLPIDDNYWIPPDTGRKCSPGQEFKENKCSDCPSGKYNFPGSHVDTCFECPIGHFSSDEGQMGCQRCDELMRGPSTTKHIGSSSSDHCVDPDSIIKNFPEATVGLHVEVTGENYCDSMRKLLYELSFAAPFGGHIKECSFIDATKKTTMQFEMTPPAKYAWMIWETLTFVHAHVDEINAYVTMGDFYSSRFLGFLNSIIEEHLEFLGMNFDASMLAKASELFHLDKFEPSFKGHCPYNAAADDIYCDKGAVEPDNTMSYEHLYLLINAEGHMCEELKERTEQRNIVDMFATWDDVPCWKNKQCSFTMKYVTCEGSSSTSSVIMAYLTASTDATLPDLETVLKDKMIYEKDDGLAIKYKVTKAVKITCDDDEGATWKSSSSWLGSKGDTVECNRCDAGHFINETRSCQKCPFTTWGEDGINCNSCGAVYETPFWGMTKEDQCIQPTDWWEEHDNYDDYLKEPKGKVPVTLTVKPRMDVCPVYKAKLLMDADCETSYGKESLKLDNANDVATWFEEGWQLEKLLCKVSANLATGYSMLCRSENGEWNKPWQEIIDGLVDELSEDSLMDVGCYIVKEIKKLEEADSTGCTGTSYVNMESDVKMDLDIHLVGLIVPLLTDMEPLRWMNFEYFADVATQMLNFVGVSDLNKFTGWKIADDVRELATEAVKNMGFGSYKGYEFAATYQEDEFFCTAGGVKRDCPECRVDVCRNDENYDLKCEVDECNNCAVRYTYKPNGGADEEFMCENMYKTCDFPDYIPNGYKTWQSHGVESMAYYWCHPPFVMNPNKDMMNHAQRVEGNDVTEAYMIYSQLAWCDRDEGRAGKIYLPECVEYKDAGHCGLPSHIHHGSAVQFMMGDGTMDDAKMPTMAKYECEEGFEMIHTMHGDIGWCRMDGSMEIPSCVERAEYMNLKFKLENGNIRKLQTSDGKKFGGVVLAMGVDIDGKPLTDWEYSCNDGANNYAAGAVCRGLGFGSGELIPVSKKMVYEKHEFGWTKFSCKYDDTLAMSNNCDASRYEDNVEKFGLKARCFQPFDLTAIRCYDSMIKMYMEMKFNRRKMTCNAQMEKKGNEMNLENMGVEVKFLLDDKYIETSNVKYRRRKGFYTRVNLKDMFFECASCEIYLGQELLSSAKKCKDESARNRARDM